MKYLILFLFTLTCKITLAQSKIDHSLMKADTAVEAIILMQQQLVPPKSLKGKSKSEKGLWVYSNGQELAQNSQQRLIDYCNRAQISFQTLTAIVLRT